MALKRYPGFIDIHVHLRDPGATSKEDFATGSRAALAGGFTFVCDMPNNPTPTFSTLRLKQKIARAKKKAVCDVGFHFGTNGKNLRSFPAAWLNPHVFGLKVYCNHTTGNFLVDDPEVLDRIFAAWRSEKPILVHAEGEMLQWCIEFTHKYGRCLHMCHISLKEEVEMVRQAKAKMKSRITAGVTPHHLFLQTGDVKKLGSYALVKPPMDPKQNQDALWNGLLDGTIDVVESDHAPHTRAEKEAEKPAYGLPGLETTVGLLFRAVKQRMLKESDIIRLLYINPKKIFHIPDQKNTFIALDPQKSYRVGEYGYQTKCGWSPFEGWKVYGRVEAVVLRGKEIYARTNI